MYDPRWLDARERDEGRARVYDERDRADHDPRDGLMHDLDLPRGDGRPDRDKEAICQWALDHELQLVEGAQRVLRVLPLPSGLSRGECHQDEAGRSLRRRTGTTASWRSQNGFCRARRTCGCRRHSNSVSAFSSCFFRKGLRSTEKSLFEPL